MLSCGLSPAVLPSSHSLQLTRDVFRGTSYSALLQRFVVPDGAAEQEGVLKDDGQARPERLQRQLGDVNAIDDDPPCEKKGRERITNHTSNTDYRVKAFSMC